MTEPALITQLIGEVRKLEGTNSASARILKEVQGEVADLNQRLADNTVELRKRQRNTLLLVLCVAVLVAGLAVGGVVAARYFSCRNDNTQKFFAAERAKVSGQIKGIQDRSIDEFTTASQHYLDTIGHINNQC